ncbi:MAG: hypothetical protein PHG65_03390, partial [Kiritimatiellae bacterium]|nr:hypothetical protein [Kiritimatiellia bacterium]
LLALPTPSISDSSRLILTRKKTGRMNSALLTNLQPYERHASPDSEPVAGEEFGAGAGWALF